ncbi:MAG: hypothetical protein HND58_01655 [Planctomycetota bacterium]|nr:MAG: hypothetical protein HND58_01655 [Planctomycetota bacterium]
MPDQPHTTGSLLDDDPTVATIGVGAHKPSLRDRLRAVEKGAVARFNAAWAVPWSRYAIMGGSSVAALALGLGIYLAIRPVPKPDYEQAEMGKIFNYTLLTEEFNRLPVEERIELISQLVDRVGDMDASESVMMAQFFAGIAGEAREQIERNAGKLLVDATDLVAKDYAAVPPEERDAYLDDAYVRLVRLTSPFDGSIDRRTDEELLERGRRDTKQGQEAMGSGEVNADQASRLLVFMNQQTAKSASPAQQQRLTLFMRDMTRRLREPGG